MCQDEVFQFRGRSTLEPGRRRIETGELLRIDSEGILTARTAPSREANRARPRVANETLYAC
jgi:hypothetical protein